MSLSGEKTQVLSVLNDLKQLLERQIVLAHQGNIKGIEALCSQTGSLVAEIMQMDSLESHEEFKSDVENAMELYRQLCLMLTAERAEAGRELKQVHKTRKMVGIYRDNIQLYKK
jgi:hypothetical protein